MRICEACEHQSIQPYPGEDSCPVNGSNKISTQCVDISAPMTLTPVAAMEAATVTCQGSPTVACGVDAGGNSCTVTMTQRVCVSVPIRYGVTMTAGEPKIACADQCGC